MRQSYDLSLPFPVSEVTFAHMLLHMYDNFETIRQPKPALFNVIKQEEVVSKA